MQFIRFLGFGRAARLIAALAPRTAVAQSGAGAIAGIMSGATGAVVRTLDRLSV
ncbi:MAG: hypothetical protein HY048_02810 [Acidobacteria bacterium]|nr:hypothetical protein [Acidobacteriota bacterium]